MNNLRKLRKALGVTQRQLQDMTGIQQTNISRFEMGKLSFTIGNFVRIAEVLGTSVDYLLERTDVAAPYPPARDAADNLRRLRERRHKTQIRLHTDTGIDQSLISRYESAQRPLSLTAIEVLADYYGVSTDYLLDRTDVETPWPPKSVVS